MNSFELIQTLTETPGPSGFEADIAAVIQKIWEPLVDQIEIDKTGSLIAIKKGHAPLTQTERPKIMLAAHMDELGLMVTNIIEHEGYGFLRVINLGGVDQRQLYGQPVVIHGKDREQNTPKNLFGIMGCVPGSMLPPAKQGKVFDFEALVVDPGLPFETVSQLVSIGDAISFRRKLRKLKGNRITGKALDNRVSVASVTQCLQILTKQAHYWDVIAVATCQEETRLLGAANTAHAYAPDIAVAIDVTFGSGPGASGENTFALGGGPVIGHMPDTHPAVRKGMHQVAGDLEMKVQKEFAARGGGTDAYNLQIARNGIPTGILGIPLRYMHTMVETAHLKDIERTGRLLASYIFSLDGETLPSFTQELMGE